MGQIRENVIKMKTYHAVRDIAKTVDIVASRRVLIDNRWKKFRSRIAFVRSFVPSRIIVYLAIVAIECTRFVDKSIH